jgi:hypothetical protein
MRTHDMEKVTRNLSILVAAKQSAEHRHHEKSVDPVRQMSAKVCPPVSFRFMVIHAAKSGVNETQDIVRS